MDSLDDDERDVLLDAMERWRQFAPGLYDPEDYERYTRAYARLYAKIDPTPSEGDTHEFLTSLRLAD